MKVHGVKMPDGSLLEFASDGGSSFPEHQTQYLEQSNEFVDVKTDAEDKIIEGTRTDGSHVYYKSVEFKEKVSFPQNQFDELSKRTENIAQSVMIGHTPIEYYFRQEMEKTINTIDEIVDDSCLVLNVITDTHITISGRGQEQIYESIRNIKHLNERIFCDGVVNIGDVIYPAATYTDKQVYDAIRDYMMRLREANHVLLPINGNHDGINALSFRSPKWYGITGRFTEPYTSRRGNSAYFFKDFDAKKVRCVFLSIPDSLGAEHTMYGFSANQLKWLAESALQTDFKVILFAHCALYHDGGNYINRAKLEEICNAFHNHTQVSFSVDNVQISANYSGRDGAIIAYINGHSHTDFIAPVGWQFQSSTALYKNNLPCNCIEVGCNLFQNGDGGAWGSTKAKREDHNYTQDLWDTLIYKPATNKIYMVRFGAGEDREILI